MKKIVLLSLVTASLIAGEFQYGKGTFKMEGGFSGLENSKSTDITTYSLFEQHQNIFNSTWFYSYDITWNESKDITQAQTTIQTRDVLTTLPTTTNTTDTTNNTTTSPATTSTPTTSTTIPATTYKYQGVDINLVLGKDLIHKSENDFVGLGVVLGASFPWIDSDSSSNNNSSTNTLSKTKTKITTYKIGPTIAVRKSFNKYFMAYANATYAYQTANVKNTELNVDENTDGSYINYGVGLRFQPLSMNKKIGFITLKPRLYFTIGYKYNKWLVKDVSLDVSGASITQKSDLKLSTSVAYLGVGYSF